MQDYARNPPDPGQRAQQSSAPHTLTSTHNTTHGTIHKVHTRTVRIPLRDSPSMRRSLPYGSQEAWILR
eukprot:44871-Pyramimonas_sp.AAC.1